MTLDQLRAFLAVAAEGGFQAASRKLHVSQPAISLAVKHLEESTGCALFSREGYRAVLSPAGHALLPKAKTILAAAADFVRQGQHLGGGFEPTINVAMVESAPFDLILRLLAVFFQQHRQTKFKLHCEGVRGAMERLQLGDVDLAITALFDFSGLETIDLGTVALIPVVAAQHPAAVLGRLATPEALHDFVQIVIRDTAKHLPNQDFGVIESTSCTVNDQETKKKLILASVGWGRLPHFMIQSELNSGALISLESPTIAAATLRLVAARRTESHGPVAESLWRFLRELAQGQKLVPLN
jgi:DNA-binding transcriptional LysR family regulator